MRTLLLKFHDLLQDRGNTQGRNVIDGALARRDAAIAAESFFSRVFHICRESNDPLDSLLFKAVIDLQIFVNGCDDGLHTLALLDIRAVSQ